MELDQQKDINRRDFCLQIINLVLWIIGMYIIGIILCAVFRGTLLRDDDV